MKNAELRRCSFLSLLLVALVGCAHGLKVAAPVTLPAQVPVRAFPSVWVAGGSLEDERYLLDRLATHLAKDGKHEIRRLELADLEPARKAGKIDISTVVVLLELSLRSGVERYWDSTPVQSCGYYGCSASYQTYVATAPRVSGEVVMTVYEGPTARVLQRERFEESALGDDSELMRAQVLQALADDLERSVDILRAREPLELYRVKKVAGVEQALEKIRKGNWSEGRTMLEQSVQSLGGKDEKTQARVWFDLGIARWFAPGKEGLTEQAYRAAERALRWAYRLEPSLKHKQALERLSAARERFQVLEEQKRATAYNFSLDRNAPQSAPVMPMAGAVGPGEPAPTTGSPAPTPGAEAPASPGPSASPGATPSAPGPAPSAPTPAPNPAPTPPNAPKP